MVSLARNNLCLSSRGGFSPRDPVFEHHSWTLRQVAVFSLCVYDNTNFPPSPQGFPTPVFPAPLSVHPAALRWSVPFLASGPAWSAHFHARSRPLFGTTSPPRRSPQGRPAPRSTSRQCRTALRHPPPRQAVIILLLIALPPFRNNNTQLHPAARPRCTADKHAALYGSWISYVHQYL